MKGIKNKYLLTLEQDLHPLLESISQHKVFQEISSIENLRTFAEHHVYAVWDFMCLIKMQECGANTRNILGFIGAIKQNKPLDATLSDHQVPRIAQDFISDTFKIIQMKVHQIASSFTFAREGITDRMFLPILQNMKGEEKVEKFIYYFQRHIDLDAGKHSQDAKMLVINLCGNDEHKWAEVQKSAKYSLTSRVAFLDGIYQKIKHKL